MRHITIGLLLMLSMAVGAQNKPAPNNAPDPKTQAKKVKMTTSEAKELCKQEGKTGPDLIACLKEKQESKE